MPVPVLRTDSHMMVLNINQGRLIPIGLFNMRMYMQESLNFAGHRTVIRIEPVVTLVLFSCA
jgi:hypothetical protein